MVEALLIRLNADINSSHVVRREHDIRGRFRQDYVPFHARETTIVNVGLAPG